MAPTRYRHYLLCILTVTLLFSYVDRLALGLLLQDIKTDLHLSDTQLGVLSGIAFALFYSMMGVPIARWADRGNRIAIIALAAGLWSIAVACCSLANSFAALLLIRVCVAVGEAGCLPPSYSLMADYFTRAERPRAAATYGLAGSLSAVIGYMIAGWLNQAFGWRMTFVLLSLPGVALAAVVWFTLEEPRQRRSQTESVTRPGVPDRPNLLQVFTTLWANVTFRHLLICLSVLIFFTHGISKWQPSFFVRSHGLTTAQIGLWLTVVWGIGGLLGALLGGELPSRYASHDERRQLRAMALAIAAAGVGATLVYMSRSAELAFCMMFLAAVGLTTVNGPLFATIQTLVPEHMRATSFALVFLVANLLGMGLGPLAVGALSDALRSWAGQESLRYALLMLAPGYLWAAAHALAASSTVEKDLLASSKAMQDAPRMMKQAHEYVG